MNQREVLIYGGLKGDDSNPNCYIFNASACSWTKISMTGCNVSPRDDHALADCGDGSFIVFGGFVRGSRVDDLAEMTPSSGQVNGRQIAGGDNGPHGPCVRASHSVCYYNKKCWVFGGQDDDNNKLGDLWCFNTETKQWSEH